MGALRMRSHVPRMSCRGGLGAGGVKWGQSGVWTARPGVVRSGRGLKGFKKNAGMQAIEAATAMHQAGLASQLAHLPPPPHW